MTLMQINPISILPIVSLIFLSGIGFFVLFRNWKGQLNQLFFMITVVFGIWMYGSYRLFISAMEYDIVFWDRFIYMGVVFMPALQYHFSLQITSKINYNKKSLLTAYLLSLGFLIVHRSDYFVDGVFRYKYGVHTLAQPLHHLFLIFFFYYVFSLLWVFYKESRENKNKTEISKYKLLILAFAILNVVGGIGYLPAYKISIYSPVSLLAPTIFSILTAYAILRYRFLDIRVVIKRSLIFTALVLLITSIFSASAFFLSSFVQTFFGQNSILVSGAITGVLVAIGFEPIKLWLTRVTDSVLFKGQVDPQVALSRASTKISALLDVRKLGEVIANTAYEVLKFDKLKVYIFDEVVQGYRLVHKVGQGGSQDLTQDNLIYQYYQIYEQDIQNKQIIAIDELRYLVTQTQDEFLTQLVAYMEQHHIALVVPLYIKNEALGFIFLGEKKSGDPYTNEDLNFLHILGAQAGISFKNAKLYEEQLKFADTLQQEVDKATKELKSANKELKKLDQAKSEFISIASHQLRTPMTAIKGYMSMVEDGDFGQVPDKIQKPVHAVLESSNRLLRLIEDLLNISRIESGRMQYEFEMGNMQRLVESVFEELQNHAKKKNLKFVYHAPQEPIPDIPMDTMKIREVVMNLADNAIKYTDTGTVELFLEVKGNEVKYWVKDTGRGLTAEDKGKLFKKFSRVGSSQLVHTEGTGLGLYIAKQIIKKHKGKLWAESEGAMKGSVFALSLKINNPELEQLIDDTAVSLDRDIVKKQMNEPMEDTIDMSRVKIRKDKK